MFTHRLSFPTVDNDIASKISMLPANTDWDSGRNVVKDEIKPAIIRALRENQLNECAYCELDIRPDDHEVDHIAEKSDYPMESFNLHNLVLSCHRCNGPRCKHDKNTVINNINNYDSWTFNIVHPYLDDPKDYYDYSRIKTIIHIKSGLTNQQYNKADNNLKIFKLNSAEMIEERKKNRIRKASKYLSRILNISSYKN